MPTPSRPQLSPEWTVGGVPVQLRHSARRRTLALKVQPGQVTLYAPVHVPLDVIHAFLEAKRAWAERHLAAAPTSPRRSLGDGAALPFMGETLTLRVQPGLPRPAREDSELLVPPGSPEDLARWIQGWYQQAARPELRALVEGYAGALGVRDRLRGVTLTAARTRWGSCNARGDIRLHWALSRAPREVAAYVALHEAAHLHELNHSARYWAHVSRLMPEHGRWRAWLGEHGHTLLDW